MKKIITLILICTACTFSLKAQDLKIPAFSPGQRIEQDLGLGTISINYGRPSAKGRKIFNGTEPYGIVWRTGANAATIIKFTDTVSIEGNTVAPGEYSLFTIPGAKEWTVILNKTAKQWGAYSYDQKQDLLRFKVEPYKLSNPVETFTIQFADVNIDRCTLQLTWEKIGLAIHLKTDVDARVIANIDQAMKGDKKPYYLAAIWYYNHNLDMAKALQWITEYDKMQPDAYNAKYWKAKIQLKLGDKKEAIKSANEGLHLAQVDKNAEYIRMNKEVLHDAGAL